MEVKGLSKSEFLEEVLKSELPVVVDFYADWCGPCRQVAPTVESLAEKWDGKAFLQGGHRG